MFDLTKLISPVKGLQMLKLGIEKNLNRPVDHFQVDYIADKRDISIKVWLNETESIRESWKGANKESLIFMIESVIKSKFKDGGSLDLASCEYLSDTSLNVSVFFTKPDGQKHKEQILNYKP